MSAMKNNKEAESGTAGLAAGDLSGLSDVASNSRKDVTYDEEMNDIGE